MSAVVVHQRAPAALPDTAKALACGLERHGWSVRNVDIDLVAGRAVVELHRFDGRWVYLDARTDGSTCVERWQRRATVTRYRGGPQCDSFEDQFLGRSRAEGPRAGLRTLCNYLADNPMPGFPALTASDARNLFRPVLQ